MGLWLDMQQRGVYTAYYRYVVRMEPILETASRRGMPISSTQHALVSAKLQTECATLLAEMQTLVPDAVKTLKVCKKKPSYYLPFKPSNKALVRYMLHKGHPVPKHFKTQKDTTDEDSLRRLYRSTGDRLYQAVLDYRDALTVSSNHLKNWRPGRDGHVHPTFYHTATGQLEARRPNTMNAPHHKDSGKLFRSIVEAEPGHTLIEFDYRGFHALYLAWLSGDKDFERLVRLDVHSYLTSHFLRLPDAEKCIGWPDAELREYLAQVKARHRAIRDAQVKHAFLGYNNGMGWWKLYHTYRDFFDKQAEAKRILALLDDLFPRAARYRRETQERAHEQGYLISQFGCIRYFWEVKKWAGPDEWKHGDDAEAALSFPAQNHAHCHLKDVILRLDEMGWLTRAQFITPIHDSLVFHCPLALRDEALTTVRAEMEKPNPTTGLSVGIETKEGARWSEMIVIK